jgi:nucleotide-binding universal stress UspA family protein
MEQNLPFPFGDHVPPGRLHCRELPLRGQVKIRKNNGFCFRLTKGLFCVLTTTAQIRLTRIPAHVILRPDSRPKAKEANNMQIRSILYPTDFSKGARAAMDHAISFAQDYDAKLILLHVVEDIPIAEWYVPSALSVADLMEDLKKSALQEMNNWVAEVSHKVKSVEKMVVNGVPFVDIIATAREKNVDLIIIGTHGRTGIDHMLFGSTAEKVVRKAACPVLTVRMGGKGFKMP